MIKKIYDQQIYIYVHILTVDLFFVGFHLESVNLLQFWHLEGSIRLGGFHLHGQEGHNQRKVRITQISDQGNTNPDKNILLYLQCVLEI